MAGYDKAVEVVMADMEKLTNAGLAKFCIEKLGVAYVMGTSGKKFTQAMYNDLKKRNPGRWFTDSRLPKVKSYIGKVTADCHGLIEWFVREKTGQPYDTTADLAYNAAAVKGSIKTIPETLGVCVRYPGHVGVYIGGGYVVEARGFNYGVCITKLSSRPWTHWYKHPRIKYTETVLAAPEPAKVGKATSKYSIIWLQLALNQQIASGYIKGEALAVDGVYGDKTAQAAAAYWRKKKWTIKSKVWGIGANTVKSLQKRLVAEVKQ